MRIIAFITDASKIRDILVHLGEPDRATPEGAKQPIAAESRRLTRTTDTNAIRLG